MILILLIILLIVNVYIIYKQNKKINNLKYDINIYKNFNNIIINENYQLKQIYKHICNNSNIGMKRNVSTEF